MNAARLTGRWQEAAVDPARMVEALSRRSTIRRPGSSPATSCAELAQLRAELAQLHAEIASLCGETTSSIAQLESRLTRRMITMLGVQIALVGIMVTILVQVLR